MVSDGLLAPAVGMDDRHWTRGEVLGQRLFWLTLPAQLAMSLVDGSPRVEYREQEQWLRCVECGVDKPAEDFHRERSRPTGRNRR